MGRFPRRARTSPAFVSEQGWMARFLVGLVPRPPSSASKARWPASSSGSYLARLRQRANINARLTSWIALVTSMPRGQASVQLNVVRQRHTPSTSLRMSSRRRPLVTAVEDEAVRVDDRRRAEVTSPRSSTPGSWWCSRRTGCTWWCRRSGRGRSGSGCVRGWAGCPR